MSQTADPATTIILAFDRLGAQHLGPYGNTWFDTAAFNRIASQSLVFDRMLAESTDRHLMLRCLWTGLHAANSADQSGLHLADCVARSGAGSVLISDDPATCNDPLASSFDSVILVEPPETDAPAREAFETQLAHFFAQAIAQIQQLQPGDFCWIHSRGLSGDWDAPTEYRRQLTGPEDPEPEEFTKPPVEHFDPESDSPDKLLQYQIACAAQVRLIDELTGVFLDQLESGEVSGQALLAVVGLGGYQLGEHRQIGPPDSLYRESIQLPCFVRPSVRPFSCSRSLSIAQSVDLHHLLKQAVSGNARFQLDLLPEKKREAAVSVSESGTAIETHAWKLICQEESRQLFVRPDDGWEVNDVLDRCEAIAGELEQTMRDQVAKMQATGGAVDVDLEDHLAIAAD